MTFAVSGFNNNGAVGRFDLVLFDTEPEARTEAINWLQKGIKDVSVWKQVATPKLEMIISWDDANNSAQQVGEG